ncbi:MAG: hypothetical protein ABIA21_00435 [Candidatus Aenigmatarchaeota archaeon]
MKKTQKTAIKNFIYQLRRQSAILQYEGMDDERASMKVVEYLRSVNISRDGIHRRPDGIDELYRLFKIYYDAVDNGEKLSFQELTKRSDTRIFYVTIASILRRLGLPSLHGSRQVQKLSSEQRDIVEKATEMDTPLSYRDMEKITGIPHYTFSTKARKKERKRKGGPTTPVNYFVAYSLCEALDAGNFTKAEAMEYAGITSEGGYVFVIEYRDTFLGEVAKFKRYCRIDVLQ